MERKIQLHIREYCRVSLLELTGESPKRVHWYLDGDICTICNRRWVLPGRFLISKEEEEWEWEWLTRRSRNLERSSRSSSHLSSFFEISGLGKYSSRYEQKRIKSVDSRRKILYRILVQLAEFLFSFWLVNQFDIEKLNVYIFFEMKIDRFGKEFSFVTHRY